MFLAGHDTQRFVAYPLTPEDPATGMATINWIAEMRVDPARAMAKGDWAAITRLAREAAALPRRA